VGAAVTTRVMLVRHGATVLSAEDRFAGSSDVPLGDEGRMQVERLAQRLATDSIAAIYGSPLRRAQETASILARPHEMAVRVWDREPVPVTIRLEPLEAERLALEYVSARLAEQRAGDSASRLAIRPLIPVPRELQRIVDSARTDVVAAGMRSAAWVTTGRDSTPSNHAVARLLMAEALLARREPALAQAMVASVLREHPCLVPPAGASSTVVELAQTARTGAPCRPVSPVRAGAFSVVPGLGNLVAHDRMGAAVGAIVVGSAIFAALHYESQAKSRYAEYLASRDPVEIPVLYQSVIDLRTQRGVAINVAVGTWIIDALWAVRSANVHNARIADDRF